MDEKEYKNKLSKMVNDFEDEYLLPESIIEFLSDKVIIPKNLYDRFYGLVKKFSKRGGKLDLELAKENIPYVLSLFNLVQESRSKKREDEGYCYSHERNFFLAAHYEKRLYTEFLENMHTRDPEFALNVLRLIPLLFKGKEARRESSLSDAYFNCFIGLAEINKEASLKFLRKINHLNDEQAEDYADLIKNISDKNSALVSRLIDLPAETAFGLSNRPYLSDSSKLNFCINMAYDAYKKYKRGSIDGRKIFSIPQESDFARYSEHLIKIKHLNILEELLPKLDPLTAKLGFDSTRSYVDAVVEVSNMNKELGLEFARNVYDLLEMFDVNDVNFYIENLLDIAQKNISLAVNAAKTLAFFMPKQDDLRFITDRICSLSSMDDAIVLEFMKNSPEMLKVYNKGILEIYSEAVRAANEKSWRTAYAVAKEFPSFVKSYINKEMPLENEAFGNGAYSFLSRFIKSNIAKEITEKEDIYEIVPGPLVGNDKFDSYLKKIIADKLQNICNNVKTYDDVLRISSIVNLDRITNLKNIIASINRFYGNNIMPDVLKTAKKSNDLEGIINDLTSAYHADKLERISNKIAEKRDHIPFVNASSEKDRIIYMTEERESSNDFDIVFIVLLGSLAEKGMLRKEEIKVNNAGYISDISFQIGMPFKHNVYVRLKKNIVPGKSELEIIGIPEMYLKGLYGELASVPKLMRYAKLSLNALQGFKGVNNIDKINVFSNVYFDKVKYATLVLDLKKKEIPSLLISIHTSNKKGMEKTLIQDKSFNSSYFTITSANTSPKEKYKKEERITLLLKHPYANLEKIRSLDTIISGGVLDDYQLAFNLYNRVKEAEMREYIIRNFDLDVMNAFFSFSNDSGFMSSFFSFSKDMWKRNRFLKIYGKNKLEQFKLLKKFVKG